MRLLWDMGLFCLAMSRSCHGPYYSTVTKLDVTVLSCDVTVLSRLAVSHSSIVLRHMFVFIVGNVMRGVHIAMRADIGRSCGEHGSPDMVDTSVLQAGHFS